MTEVTAVRDTGHAKALAVLVTGAAIIGLAPILVRLADAGPAAIGFWRVTFAMPLLALIAMRTDGGVGRPSKFALLAGVAFACDLGFWHYSIHFTSVANATVLTNLTPVVVTAAAWIFLKQRPAKLFVAAVGLAVAGAWLMAIGRGEHAAGANPPLGDALALTTAVWYALYFRAISAARRSVGATRVMFWSGVAGREAQRHEGLDRRADASALIGPTARVAPNRIVAAVIALAAQQVGDPRQGQPVLARAGRVGLQHALQALDEGPQLGMRLLAPIVLQ